MPVPIMPGMKPGMSSVGLGNNNAHLAGLPNSVAGAGQGGAIAVGGALPDKMNTLFIGSIAPGINKVAMEKLLKVSLFFIAYSLLFYFCIDCVLGEFITQKAITDDFLLRLI